MDNGLLTNPAHCPSTSVPTTGLYIIPMDWKSNSTQKNLRQNFSSSSGTKVMLTLAFGSETVSANKLLVGGGDNGTILEFYH